MEGGKDGFGVVIETALGGIGGGEIKEGDAGGAEFVESDSEAIAGERPVGAGGEHGRVVSRQPEAMVAAIGCEWYVVGD